MADTSLDDFFAKKDKNKKKSKNKLAATTTGAGNNDIMGSQQMNSGLRKNRKKKDSEKQSSLSSTGTTPTAASATMLGGGTGGVAGGSATTANIISNNTYINSTTVAENRQSNLFLILKEDQEWNDYEQETEKDYSGLRIQNLQIKSDEDYDVDNEQNADNDEVDENGDKRESNTGPWNKTGTALPAAGVVAAPQKQVIKEEDPIPSEETPKTVGRYVPPAQRGHNTSKTPTEARMARIRNSKKEAPNIHCEVDFPSLGGPPVNEINDCKDFERVRSGNRHLEDPSNNSLHLKLNNKYRALQE